MILANPNSLDGPSFSRRNRLARLAWQLVWLLLFRPTPPPLHAWRCWLLRCFGARIAAGCHVYSDARIWAPWNLVMATKACIGPRVICYSMAPIQLGERVVISQGAHLCTGSHDYTSTSFKLFAKPITIGSDAWICTEAFVGPGVQIGEGAVIGARAVAMRSQPAWMVCTGNPANPIKPRNHPLKILSIAKNGSHRE
jgi:putative colanic acid biosynthesis acetyltransferase WcaF